MMSPRSLLFPALLAVLLVFAPARARAEEGDVVHIGHSIHVPADASVEDAVCIFCSVHVEGKVTGDVVAIFGDVDLRGDAQHDVVNIFGSFRAAKGASVEDDVVSIFGVIRLGDGVAIGHDLVALFGSLAMANSATVGGDRVIRSIWIVLAPLLLAALVIFLLVREYQNQKRMRMLRGYPPPRMR